jgi:hypothetical protein
MNLESNPYPTFRDDDAYLVLLCSGCGGDCTHHEKVEVFSRTEDASEGTHVVVDDTKVNIDDDISRNPSGRRHGILIHYWCENCETRSVLTISQHKGWTLVDNMPYPRYILKPHL